MRSLPRQLQGAQDFLLPYWVESSVSDLLAALEANRGLNPLSNRQIWDAMVGGPMPGHRRQFTSAQASPHQVRFQNVCGPAPGRGTRYASAGNGRRT